MEITIKRDKKSKDWAVYDGAVLVGYRGSFKEAFDLKAEYIASKH